MTDLIETLREEAKWGNPCSGETLKLIEALERENNDMVIHFDGLVARIEKLEAALQWYAEHCRKGGDEIEGPFGDYGQRARKALEGKNG